MVIQSKSKKNHFLIADNMKVIAGLGNVGDKYTNTRHNIGFTALDLFALQIEQSGNPVTWKNESKFDAIIAKVKYLGQDLLLVKPTTFMNLSGLALQKILSFHKIAPENLAVVYDDIDLPLGKIRIRTEGSAGTHNGMKSIIQELGTDKFTRIRIGIESRGDLAPKEQDLASFVLSRFTEAEQPLLKTALAEATKEIQKFI